MESTIGRQKQKASNRRTLIIALILGAVAAGLVVAFLSSADSNGSGSPPVAVKMRSVVVAKQEIPVGVKIEEKMLERKEIPESAAIVGGALAFDEVVGEIARYPVAQGEQLNAQRLVAKTEVQALSFQIPAGLRGFTIPVEVNTSPAALLAPGDFVDVLVVGKLVNIEAEAPAPVATRGAGDQDPPKVVVTLLQNVQVLSVQREYVSNGVPYDSSVRGAPPKEDRVSYVTLALTPEQSQMVWLAGQEGKMTLALRAFGDDKTRPLSPVVEPLRISP